MISKNIYSYLKALNVLIFEILVAGKYDAIEEIIRNVKITKIELKLISLGNSSKKYIGWKYFKIKNIR